MSTTIPTPASPQEVPPFPVRRFTIDEYHELMRLGVLTEDDRVELLEGWLVPKMGHNPPHDAVVELVMEALRARLPPGWRVRDQSAVTTSDSEPEPDVALIRGTIRDYLTRHPGPEDLALVVEVSDSTVARDRLKRRIYACAGIPYYWIINLQTTKVEVYSDPAGSGTAAAYRQQVEVGADGQVSLVIEGREVASIPARELLP